MSRWLRVSPSGDYGWVSRPSSGRTQEDARFLARIRQLHADQNGVVGSPRMWEDLRDAGEQCGRHRVARLMRRAGLCGIPQPRRWRPKPSGTPPEGTRNHLERNFTTTAPNTKWATGITYVRTAEHWVYLGVSLCGAGFVFGAGGGLVNESASGPAVGDASDVDGVVAAVGPTPVILHSDRRCQFTSKEYQRFLEAHQVICSMSTVRSCADNAAAESFFRVLNHERVNRQYYQARAEARADIFDYIERCHNPQQRRRLDGQQQEERPLTQPSVVSG